MKNLSQIPRKINTRFCYGLEFSDHFEDETTAPKFSEKNEKVLNSEEKKAELEKFLATENKESDRKEAEKLLNDPTLTKAENKDSEVAYDVEATGKKFDLQHALDETNKLLANLDEEVNARGFRNMDYYDA